MKPYRILLTAVAVAAAALVLSFLWHARRAAAADSLPKLLELAPAGADFYVYVDLAELRDVPVVRRLFAMSQTAKIDRDYADFVTATGFDYQRDLDRLVIAERSGKPSAQTLAFAEGRFDHKKIEQYALRSGKIEREGGRAVYVVPSGTPGKSVSVTFLAADRLALSDGGDLSAVGLDSPAALDQTLRDRFSRVAGAPLFALGKVSAPGADGKVNNGGAIVSSTPFQSLRWVSFAARPDGEEVLLSAEGECDTADQAENVATGLELLRGLLRSGLANPKGRGKMPAATAATVDHLLGAARVSTDTARVRLLLTVTPEMLGSPGTPQPRPESPPATGP